MEFRILGPIEAVEGGKTVPLGAPKQRALFALLLLDANRVVPTDRLIDALWGEQASSTAQHTIQVYVSALRKALGRESVLVTHAPGYMVRVAREDFDLYRFERLVEHGRIALARGDPEEAAGSLREALALWRGPALADFAFELWAQAPAGRLEELRVAAVEDRFDAELALGRHAGLIGELEAVLQDHPLRERPRAQLMLALYRAGRQAESLAAYQDARRTLIEELGIEPGPALQQLERAILNQSADLEWQPTGRGTPAAAPTPARSILVAAEADEELDRLLALAAPLARAAIPHEVIAVVLVPPSGDLVQAAANVQARRDQLLSDGVPARAAAFTSADPGADLVRLAAQQEVDLVVLDGEDGREPRPSARRVLEEAPCDVALAVDGPEAANGPVALPFAGGEHDWAALELGCWLAGAHGASLRLLGTAADPAAGRRDASRLLASASLAVQGLAGVPGEPMLVDGGAEALAAAVMGARALVLGLPERWRTDWLGGLRVSLVQARSAPVLIVRRGTRPGGLTPPEGLTRFTWSLAPRDSPG